MDRIWEPNKHVTQLDGLRGLAILIVTCYRFTKSLPHDSAVGGALRSMFYFGERGVDLFFVLSGFLITGVLLDALSSSGPQRPLAILKNFLIRRSLRIFPLYYLSLAILLILSATPAFRGVFSEAADRQFYLWTYLTNVQMTIENSWCFGYLDHFWSLAVEEHFYLLWPFLVLLLPSRRLLLVAFGIAGLAAVGRVAFTALANNDLAPDVLSVFRFDALLIGSALAIAARNTNLLRAGVPVGISVAVFCAIVGVAMKLTSGRLLTIPHTVWAMIWAGVLLALIASKPNQLLSKVFNLKFLQRLGKYSYAMYVFQNPLIPLVGGVLSLEILAGATGSMDLACLLYPASMFALTIGAALISWYCLEQPVLRLKKYFPMKAKPMLLRSDQESAALKHSDAVVRQ